eukprot:6203598-Pleurochrysis_carterae.AAC.3
MNAGAHKLARACLCFCSLRAPAPSSRRHRLCADIIARGNKNGCEACGKAAQRRDPHAQRRDPHAQRRGRTAELRSDLKYELSNLPSCEHTAMQEKS